MDRKMPERKNTRLSKYDYSLPGYYFITICTAVRKQNVLCSLHHVGGAALGAPQVVLTPEGKIVDQYIQNINTVYSKAIRVDQYVIMPDHIHLLLEFRNPEHGSPRAATPTELPRIINTLKSLTTKKIGRSIWQRGYYDHIIRNDADLSETRTYIRNNPLKECDCNG